MWMHGWAGSGKWTVTPYTLRVLIFLGKDTCLGQNGILIVRITISLKMNLITTYPFTCIIKWCVFSWKVNSWVSRHWEMNSRCALWGLRGENDICFGRNGILSEDYNISENELNISIYMFVYTKVGEFAGQYMKVIIQSFSLAKLHLAFSQIELRLIPCWISLVVIQLLSSKKINPP